MPVYTTPRLKSEYQTVELNTRTDPSIVVDGFEFTAENIWNYDGDRNELVDKAFHYFRNLGFQYPDILTPEEINGEFKRLQDFDIEDAIDKDTNTLKNTSSICLNVCRFFNNDIFYKVRDKTTLSLEDAFNDDETLKEVLRNRMGWCTQYSKDKSFEIPYLFDITHKMVCIQGMHSSRKGFSVSNFRPTIAKFLLKKYGGESTLDLSAGWGARYLGAKSLNIPYFGIDPLTAPNLNKIINFFQDTKSKSLQAQSEDDSILPMIPNVDSIIWCPPYFTLEMYDEKSNEQSTNTYPNYFDWMEKFVNQTIQNVKSKLNPNGKLILIILDKFKSFNLKDDFNSILEENGFQLQTSHPYLTIKSHLSNKRENKSTFKNSEVALIYFNHQK